LNSSIGFGPCLRPEGAVKCAKSGCWGTIDLYPTRRNRSAVKVSDGESFGLERVLSEPREIRSASVRAALPAGPSGQRSPAEIPNFAVPQRARHPPARRRFGSVPLPDCEAVPG
jgi:hypothetical protein